MSDQELINGPIVRAIPGSYLKNKLFAEDFVGQVVAVIMAGDVPDHALMNKLFGIREMNGRSRPTLPSAYPRVVLADTRWSRRVREFILNDTHTFEVIQETPHAR